MKTHGKFGSRVYTIWAGMKSRATNPRDKYFSRYGGVGIGLCERWHKFENFYEDMGEPPANHSIDRINNNKGYSPNNCRWATQSQQCRNRKNNVLLTYRGRTKTMGEWAIEFGIKKTALSYRLKAGWSIAEALETKSRTNWHWKESDARHAKNKK